MEDADIITTLKILLIGESGVGKSRLVVSEQKKKRITFILNLILIGMK